MGEFQGFFLMMAIIIAVIIFNKFLYWWVKTAFVIYYVSVTYIYISVTKKIDKQYLNVIPVPDAYWDKNSGWVDTIADYIFFPFSVILLFIFYKWYTSRDNKQAKGYVLAISILTIAIILFFILMFKFVYGYRP